MKRILAASAVALVAALAIVGCEWSTHDDDVQSYNDTVYGWINFSGSYQKYATDPVYHNVYQDKDIPDESQLSADRVVATASGPVIRVLAVAHKGQRLTITDNAGGSYKGSISDLRTAMGKTSTTNFADGDVVVATFSCSGTSGAGLPVTMTGTFQGEIINNGQAFAKRTISGTWIEQGGRGATIYGAAEPIVRYGYNGSSGSPLETTRTTSGEEDSGEGGGSSGDVSALTVKPGSFKLSNGDSQTITASGGDGTYLWTILNGVECVTLDKTEGKTVVATWKAAGSATVEVASGTGAKKVAITCLAST